jgi:hypothetical protein
MNVEIGAEAALFPEKEYINGIAVAVQSHISLYKNRFSTPHLEISCPRLLTQGDSPPPAPGDSPLPPPCSRGQPPLRGQLSALHQVGGRGK